MEKECPGCGQTFTAARANAKYCSERCKKRCQRGSGAQVVELKAKPDRPATKAKAEEPAGNIGSVEAAAIKTLTDAGRLNSVMGQAALVLARRLDATTVDTGSAVASVVKQLELALDAATAGAMQAADPVDELRNRRDRKLGIVG
jgi:hypothetical protein